MAASTNAIASFVLENLPCCVHSYCSQVRLWKSRLDTGMPRRLAQAMEALHDASSDSAASSHNPACRNECAGMWRAWLAAGAIFAKARAAGRPFAARVT